MEFNLIRYTTEGPIATLTINRPKALNALNADVLTEMEAAVDAVAKDEALRVLIITGAKDELSAEDIEKAKAKGREAKPKPPAFVAGADIVVMSTLPESDDGSFLVDLGQRVMQKLEDLSIPVIAAVDGFALGGGTELALSCDIIYATTRSAFGQPEVKLGLIPGFGGTQRLPRLIGRNMAKELIYTGDHIDAETALRVGIANKICEPDKLMDEVMGLAKRIISCAPKAVGLSKQAINQGFNKDLPEGNVIEVDCFKKSFASAERVEGTNAFVQRRKPNF